MLPKGWVEVEASEVGTWGSGGTPKSTDATYYNGNIPWIRSGDLPDRQITRHEIEITESGLNACAAKWVATNSVLIALYGATIGKVGLTTYPVTTNQAVAFCTPCEGINSHYLARYFLSIREKLISLGQGGAQPNISQIILKQQIVPLPPLAEQRRIVAELDRLTARIARARAELERVRALQKQWLSKFFDTEFSCDGELLRLGELAEDIRYGTAQKCSPDPTLTPVLRIPNIASGKIDISDLKHSKFTEKEIKKLSLCRGDLLIVRSNGSVDLVGQSAVADARVSGFLFAGYLIRIRLRNKDITPYFVHYWLRSSHARSLINAAAKSTSGVNNINSEQLKNLSVRLPSRLKQQEIVSRITKACSHGNRLETETRHALALLDRLESSLLAKLPGRTRPAGPE